MNAGARFGAAVLAMVLAGWALASISSYDVIADVDPSRASLGPSLDHWLGTDHLGRDVAWRLLKASQAFMGPGLLACTVSSLPGVAAGALAGFFGGPIAYALRYLATVIATLPRFVLVLLAITIYGDNMWILGAAAGLAYAPTLAEAVYNRIDSLKRDEFVLAARAHGLGSWRILWYHLLWINCRYLVGRHALYLFSYTLLLETTLSYIGGFGVKEPTPSWGNMLAFEFGQRDGNPWGAWAPALAIWLTILACNLLANSLVEKRRA